MVVSEVRDAGMGFRVRLESLERSETPEARSELMELAERLRNDGFDVDVAEWGGQDRTPGSGGLMGGSSRKPASEQLASAR